MNENHYYRRGNIYLADLNPYVGSEQGGTRPVLVLQNNAGNYFCPTVIVAPITSKGTGTSGIRMFWAKKPTYQSLFRPKLHIIQRFLGRKRTFRPTAVWSMFRV